MNAKRVLIALLLTATALPAVAQDAFPAKPIRIVVPFAAGSSSDDNSRFYAELMQLSILEPGPKKRPLSAGHLSAAGLHRVLKSFFRAVAKECAPHVAESFEQASCHWLRHTFAHDVLKASGNDLTVTQQLLAHKNLSTTGLYLKADMSSRIAAVKALPERYIA